MADSYSMVPLSALDDERLDGDAGPVRAAFALVMLVTDDWGRFEGDTDALARRLGVSADWMGPMLVQLEGRGLIELYAAPGRRRLVGEVIGYADYPGHAPRKSAPSTRAASLYPGRDGEITPGKNARRAAPDAAPKKAGNIGQGRGKVGASSGKAAGNPEGKTGQARGRAEERRGEEIRDPPASQSDQVGPPEGAPTQPTPAASTDARATSAPIEPDPEPRAPVASPPALGGAGEAPSEDAQEQQQDPEPPPRPRPRPLTRAEEAERVRQLREQLAAVQAAAGGAP